MNKARKKMLSALLAVVMLFSLCSNVFAAETQPALSQTEKGHAVFSGISQLALHESIQYLTKDADGGQAVVGIEKVETLTRSGGETWRVWYKGINSSVEFYMTVSNNKVTSVYDYRIVIIGGSYSDAVLTNTSTYGILTFKVTGLAGLVSGTCWLKGTVTGVDDQIEVTWQM